VSLSPFSSKSTSAECPSFEIVAGRMFATSGRALSFATTAATPSRGDPCFDCTSTLSPATCRNPAPARIRSARAVSPCESSTSVSVRVPAAVPRTTAATTSTSQPKVAVFQCAALHAPALAARLPFITASLCVS
jgi:hypothetical protein